MEGLAAAPTNSGSFLTNTIAFYQEGGWVMHLILLAGCVTLFLAIWKYLQLKSLGVNAPAFMNEVSKLVIAKDLDGALRHCDSAGGAALPYICKAGLKRVNRIDRDNQENQQVVANSVSGAVLEMVPKVERYLPVLSLIANVATLFGLLGTIMGLVRTFQAIGSVAVAAERTAKLAAGISEAMHATAFGLIVAICAMILHTLFSLKADSMIGQLNEYAVKLMNLLSYKQLEHSGNKVD